MIKVMWFLKRADHLSLEEFRRWWIDRHVHLVSELQRPYLKRYKVSVRTDGDALPGHTGVPFDWDGCAEQWFDTEEDFRAVYGRATPSASREDSLEHVSRMSRMIVEETEIPVAGG